MQVLPYAETGLDPETQQAYALFGRLPDGRICGLHRLMFHWTMHLDILPWGGHEGRYCFKTEALALQALLAWDGAGDPPGWHKHYPTESCPTYPQIRYHDPNTGQIWLDGELRPDPVEPASAAAA